MPKSLKRLTYNNSERLTLRTRCRRDERVSARYCHGKVGSIEGPPHSRSRTNRTGHCICSRETRNQLVHWQEIIRSRKYHWQLVNSEDALKKLGPTLIRSLKSLNARLLNHQSFRRNMTPQQFKKIVCPDSSCGVCEGKDAQALLDSVNRDTLKSIPSECISRLNWTLIGEDGAKAIVPHLSDKAFETTTSSPPPPVLTLMRGAQMAEYDSKDKDSQCEQSQFESCSCSSCPSS